MSIKLLSSQSIDLIQHPRVASNEQIQTFEFEINQLIEQIAQQHDLSSLEQQQYTELSKRVHEIAEYNPQLKNIDATFKKLISSSKHTQKNPPKSHVTQIPRPIRDNPINLQEQQAWIEAHQDPTVMKALQELTQYIRHVTQEEFESSLQATTQHLNTILEQEEGEYIIAVEKGKSNKWVADLAKPHLLKQPAAEVSLVFPLFMRTYLANKTKDPTTTFPKCIVLFDDAAYSGEQLSRVVRSIFRCINDHNLAAGSEQIPIPKIIIASPYMTKFAEQSIKKKVSEISMGQPKDQHSAIEHLEILPYNQIMTIKELIPNPRTLNLLTQLWWPNEMQLERPGLRGYGLQARLESTKDLSPSQFAHKKGVESRGTTYFSFKIPDQDSFLGPLAEGKIVMKGRLINPEKTFEVIPRTVPPYKPNFAQFCKEIENE